MRYYVLEFIDGTWRETGIVKTSSVDAQHAAWARSEHPGAPPVRILTERDWYVEQVPHAAAAQARLDAGKKFTLGYRRMVARGDAEGVTAVDSEWADYERTVDEASYRGQ